MEMWSLRLRMGIALLAIMVVGVATVLYELWTVDASATPNSLRMWVVALMAAMVVMSVLAGWWLESYVARTLRQLKETAERVANGDFSQKMPVNSADELGELAGVFNQMADRFKDSYRRLAVEKQRAEALLESMGEGLIALDADGKIAQVNSVAIELLGLTSRKLTIDADPIELFELRSRTGDKLPKKQRPECEILREHKPLKGIYQLVRANRKPVLLNVNASPIELNKKTVGAILVLRDVTQEQEVDRMKTEFISLASHQLRTPLSAIKWFTEILLDGEMGKLNKSQTEFADNIAQSTERMIDLVNSLLNISRIESGRIIVDPVPTDLNKLVSSLVNDVKKTADEKEQTLEVKVDKNLPKINLDPQLITQVYVNLLTNALKYTPQGGKISVRITKKGDSVLSEVSDNGFGIPKNAQSKIFQKFFRADNVVKVETDGTGLGLYLIKAIVDSSDGKIWFESVENKGTTFWFSLPLSGMKPKKGEVRLDATRAI